MKKILIAVFAISLFVCSSCKKEKIYIQVPPVTVYESDWTENGIKWPQLHVAPINTDSSGHLPASVVNYYWYIDQGLTDHLSLMKHYDDSMYVILIKPFTTGVGTNALLNEFDSRGYETVPINYMLGTGYEYNTFLKSLNTSITSVDIAINFGTYQPPVKSMFTLYAGWGDPYQPVLVMLDNNRIFGDGNWYAVQRKKK